MITNINELIGKQFKALRQVNLPRMVVNVGDIVEVVKIDIPEAARFVTQLMVLSVIHLQIVNDNNNCKDYMFSATLQEIIAGCNA